MVAWTVDRWQRYTRDVFNVKNKLMLFLCHNFIVKKCFNSHHDAVTKSNQSHINNCNNRFSDQWSDAMWNMTCGRGGTDRQHGHGHRESRVWWALLHNGHYYRRYKGIRDYEWSLWHKHNCTTHAPLWYIRHKPEFLDLRPLVFGPR